MLSCAVGSGCHLGKRLFLLVVIVPHKVSMTMLSEDAVACLIIGLKLIRANCVLRKAYEFGFIMLIS